jgi:hypothetical protein
MRTKANDREDGRCCRVKPGKDLNPAASHARGVAGGLIGMGPPLYSSDSRSKSMIRMCLPVGSMMPSFCNRENIRLTVSSFIPR